MTIEEAKTFLDNLKVCIEEHPIVADWLVEIADRKTEPSGSEKPSNCDGCKEGQEDCYGCPFVKWDEPKTERTCTNCKHNGVLSVPKCDECHDMDKHEFIEPQTDCSWR